MPNLINNVPLIAKLAFGGAVLISVAVALRVVLWRIQNVLVHRLPKPFLGNDSNMEWAETKRIEIATGALDSKVSTQSANGYQQSRPHTLRIELNGNGVLLSNETDLDEYQEQLLRPRLAEPGRVDDEWA